MLAIGLIVMGSVIAKGRRGSALAAAHPSLIRQASEVEQESGPSARSTKEAMRGGLGPRASFVASPLTGPGLWLERPVGPCRAPIFAAAAKMRWHGERTGWGHVSRVRH